MTKNVNERRINALAGAFDRAIQTMIANANAAGWSTDEVLAAVDAAVAKLKISNAHDPDPADDPETMEESDILTGMEGENRPRDNVLDHQAEDGPAHSVAADEAALPSNSATADAMIAQGQREAAAMAAERLANE